MTIPPYLKSGDTIGIVSTARKISLPEMEASLKIIEEWDVQPFFGKTTTLEHHQFAGTDHERADDFQKMLDDEDIKAIWCARGGYGTVRIIDFIDFTHFKKYPKWIIGYSDITVLHSHIHNFGITTMHAPMPVDFHKCTQEAKQVFKKLLFGEKVSYEIQPSSKNKLGSGSGQLIGGNVSVLYSLCGSVSATETDGKILCIEDLDEYLYHIDRMLQNLKRNSYFEKLHGLIVGGMNSMHDNIIPFGKTVPEIILEVVSEYDFPVVFDFPMGHIENNQALILGAEVLLEVGEDGVRMEYI